MPLIIPASLQWHEKDSGQGRSGKPGKNDKYVNDNLETKIMMMKTNQSNNKQSLRKNLRLLFTHFDKR